MPRAVILTLSSRNQNPNSYVHKIARHQSTRLLLFLLSAIALGFPACTPTPTDPRANHYIDIAIHNNSSTDLDWVRIEWNGPYVPGGIVPKSITKTAVATYFPTDQKALLRFVDASTRDLFMIDIPLTEFHRIDPLTIEILTFVITSYTTAEVHVNGKKISAASATAPPASDLTRE